LSREPSKLFKIMARMPPAYVHRSGRSGPVGRNDGVRTRLPHVAWDGSETQNDKATVNVHGVAGSPVTNGIGAVPLDHSVLGNSFEDQITPINGALTAYTDDSTAPDALSFSGGH
jgi:hypothetical protein